MSLSINNFDAQRVPRSFWGTFSEVYRKEAFVGDGETFGIDLSPGSQINYSRIFYQHPDIFRRHFDPVGVITEFQLRDRIFRSHDEGEPSRARDDAGVRPGGLAGERRRAVAGAEDPGSIRTSSCPGPCSTPRVTRPSWA